jgi:hypothetical protein
MTLSKQPPKQICNYDYYSSGIGFGIHLREGQTAGFGWRFQDIRMSVGTIEVKKWD